MAVIGIQLIATRYSPRMISLFTDSPIFIYTFCLFVLSVALDLGLLYNVPLNSTRIFSAGIGAASGLAITAAVGLFVFVRTAIRQSTPDGAIDAFVSGMTSTKYLERMRESVESESEVAHPMHPLYNLAMNALSSGERVTAEKAVQEYGDLVLSIILELEERNTFEDEENQVRRQLFKPVFKEHLHDIALHAEEQNENQIVSNAIEWQYELGKEGLDLEIDRIARQAQFGMSDVLRDAPLETGSYISSNNVWEQIGQFLVDASDKPAPRIARNTASSIETNISSYQLHKISDARWYSHSMMRLYSKMEDAQEALLDHYAEDVANVDMEWQYEHVPDDIHNREEVYSVFEWRNTLLSTTASFLQYAIEEGQYPITDGNFKDSWQNICVEASKTPAEDYAITLCQALIEIAVIDRNHIEETGIPWSSTIGRVKHKGNPEIVEKAFERILQYDYVEKEPGPLFAGEMEERRQTYYQGQLNVQDTPTLNNRPDFPEEIEEIRREADERWNSLRD
ncbi:hypothetical protein GOC85_14965 [Haloferax alexandrinus]|uniref:DUF2254 domain-containing protein n=1 Tax=Haloferax volcanii TaxID=2246 RepID=A0A847TTS4_HALVO|nr:hypothetical protein [Haloferax alexandrinus]